MDVNIALGLLAALVVLASQPCNTEGRNIICRKDLHKLQKRSGEGVVLIEGYEVTPTDEERGADCVEYEAAALSPTPPSQTTTENKVPYTVTPIQPPQKPSKTQCWVYYGKPVKLYVPVRNLSTLPNSQRKGVVCGTYTGRVNGLVNTQHKVVCGKMQMTVRIFPKGLQDHTNGNPGKQDNKGSGAVKPTVGRAVIQVPTSGSSSFYNFLKTFQRVSATQKPRGSSASSRCG